MSANSVGFDRPSTVKTVSPGDASGFGKMSSTVRPTMRAIRLAGVASATSPAPTARPSRNTV